MPAGCEFICRNETCEQQDKGFVVTAPWPVGRIELIINSLRVKSNPAFRQHLIDLKNGGRKYACIAFPNNDHIPVEGFRIQLWSEQASCIWEYHIPIDEFDENTDPREYDIVPDKCPTSGGPLLAFTEVINEGILCPHCLTSMEQSRWFTSESAPEPEECEEFEDE